MAAVQPDVQEEHWGTQVYEAMVLRGVDPHDMQPNFEDGKGAHVILAMPEAKVALATDGDSFDSLVEDGWQVLSVPVGALKSYASTARDLNTLVTDYRVRTSSSQMLKTGSEDEERLLNAILRAHLPMPDRNFRVMREDAPGQELTVPDFTWPRYRVAFFMDGLWWHVGRDSDIAKKVATGTADAAVLEEAEKQQMARATRDANNRSELTLMGWTVLSCSDESLTTEAGILEQVERIKKALRNAQERAGGIGKRGLKATSENADDMDDIDELLGVRKNRGGYSPSTTEEKPAPTRGSE